MHLGLHATIHRFAFGLRPLFDIAETVSRLAVDWNLLRERIRLNGAGRAVRIPLLLAGNLLKAAIPEDEMRRLQHSSLPEDLWEEARETVLLNSPWRSTREAPNPNLVLFFGRKRWRDKLSLAFRRIFPSRRMISALYSVPANSLRVFLYYPVSFRALFRRNALALRGFLSGKSGRSAAYKNAVSLMDWLLTRE